MTTKENLVDIIHQCQIFSGIEPNACLNLLSRVEEVSLAKDEILFNQGDPSDSLYIIIEGTLIASLNIQPGVQKPIGLIEKGETVGEMGAISGQPRSLTIRAISTTKLLKLTQAKLQDFFKDFPSTIFPIINLIINRSQTVIKILTEKNIYKHVAIIQGNDETSLEPFLNTLKQNLNEKFEITLINDAKLNIAEEMTKAENQNRTLIFVLSTENESSIGSKIEHINAIFVVADAQKQATLSKFALDILKGNKTHFATQYELVLLHDDNTVHPTGTNQWLKLSNFTLHHHIKKNESLDYQRLIRFMTGNTTGLVLGGGGGKGWVSIGVLKALMESEIPIDLIGGTSIGSFVASCYSLNSSFHQIASYFKGVMEITSEPFALRNLTWPIISLLSGKNQNEFVTKFCRNKQIEDTWIPYFAISCNLNTGKEIIHRQGSLFEAIWSSSALPGLVPPMLINGELHVDGGLINNLPVDIMRSMLGKKAKIIAVSLSDVGEDKKKYNFPLVLPLRAGLLYKLKLGYKDYQFPPFFNNFLNALLVGASAREKSNRLIADILVSPNLTKYKTFDPNLLEAEEMIDIGYQETKKMLNSQL